MDADSIPPLEEALQKEREARRAETAADKVLLLAQDQRDACKMRKKLAAHDAMQARANKRAKPQETKKKKKKLDKTEEETPRTKKKKEQASKKGRTKAKTAAREEPEDAVLCTEPEAEQDEKEGHRVDPETEDVLEDMLQEMQPEDHDELEHAEQF